MAAHEDLFVKIDYTSIVLEIANAKDVVMHTLGLPTDIFNVCPVAIKFKTYQARWQIGDIYVSEGTKKTKDSPQGLDCYLVMTGRGCNDIFRILNSRNYTLGDMFKRCERRYGPNDFHFTKPDIVTDDKNEKPLFVIEQIGKKYGKEEFISNSEGYHFNESEFDDFDITKTIYIGVGKSGLSYRFHDKDKEVCSEHNKTLDEVGSQKRTEMQLHDDKAHASAVTSEDRPLELGELAFGLLANNLRFVMTSRNESNRSRRKTCRFRERSLGAVEVLELQVPKPRNSPEETQQQPTEGGVISAAKNFYLLEEHGALGELEKVGIMLDKTRYSTSFSSKLTAHLQRINRTDLIPYVQYDTKHGKGGI